MGGPRTRGDEESATNSEHGERVADNAAPAAEVNQHPEEETEAGPCSAELPRDSDQQGQPHGVIGGDEATKVGMVECLFADNRILSAVAAQSGLPAWAAVAAAARCCLGARRCHVATSSAALRQHPVDADVGALDRMNSGASSWEETAARADDCDVCGRELPNGVRIRKRRDPFRIECLSCHRLGLGLS